MSVLMDRGALVWISGLPSSGKSTLASAACDRLRRAGIASCVLDGDAVRAALVPPPGYAAAERERFYRTLGNLAALLAGQGLVVLVAATAHRSEYRAHARAQVGVFLEVEVATPLEECRRRDTKGLYAAFAARHLDGVPGEDLAYERAGEPALVASGGHDEQALESLVELVRTALGRSSNER
jgi:adenylylsulfate kinase